MFFHTFLVLDTANATAFISIHHHSHCHRCLKLLVHEDEEHQLLALTRGVLSTWQTSFVHLTCLHFSGALYIFWQCFCGLAPKICLHGDHTSFDFWKKNKIRCSRKCHVRIHPLACLAPIHADCGLQILKYSHPSFASPPPNLLLFSRLDFV